MTGIYHGSQGTLSSPQSSGIQETIPFFSKPTPGRDLLNLSYLSLFLSIGLLVSTSIFYLLFAIYLTILAFSTTIGNTHRFGSKCEYQEPNSIVSRSSGYALSFILLLAQQLATVISHTFSLSSKVPSPRNLTWFLSENIPLLPRAYPEPYLLVVPDIPLQRSFATSDPLSESIFGLPIQELQDQ